jgi:hypothetical protein
MADRIRPHSDLIAPRPNQAAVAFVVTDEAFRARVHVARGRHRWAPRRSASSACRGDTRTTWDIESGNGAGNNTLKKKGE